MQKNQFIDIMEKILSEFVKENLGKKVSILKFNVEGEIVGYNSKLKAIIIRSLIENFGIDIIDVSINLNTVKLQEEQNPLEEETLILSDFWY